MSANVLVQVKTLVYVNVKIMLVVVKEKEGIYTFLFFKINIIKYLFKENKDYNVIILLLWLKER